MIKILLKNKTSGFTLIELIVSMAIFSLIMTMILSNVHSMTIARIQGMNRIALTDQLYLFSEQLFTTIKNGGTIDYEEYWNRFAYNQETENGHYKNPSGVGNYGKNGKLGENFGNDFYYCMSSTTEQMKYDGCLEKLNHTQESQKGFQRFGQYELQFWDMNSNMNNDNGDEDKDKDGNITNDEDDKNLWNGPEVFSKNDDGTYSDPIELYLIDKTKKTRTFIRWKVIDDPNRPTGTSCNYNSNTKKWNDSCLGNLQILKMRGHDFGLKHKSDDSNPNTGLFDGKIDTWVCETGWTCQGGDSTSGKVATGQDAEWINLFPANINVRDFKLDIYPKKDPWLSAAALDCPITSSTNLSSTNCVSPFIHPYIKISLELGFAHGARRSLRGENPIISLPITISLDDFR